VAFGPASDVDFFIVSDELHSRGIRLGVRGSAGALLVGATQRFLPDLGEVERQLSERLGRKATIPYLQPGRLREGPERVRGVRAVSIEIYFDTSMSLDELATEIRRILNLPDRNGSHHQVDQRRFGENMGGTYYLFEVLGFTLTLLANLGEAEIPERYDHAYYLMLEGGNEDVRRVLGSHLEALFRAERLNVVVDSLAS